MNPKTETINIAPSWAATARMLTAILEGGPELANKKWAREEIVRMGKIIDAHAAEDAGEVPAPTPAIVND